MHNYNYIAIEGNIGAGKTTLATRLAREMNARLVLEEFADNPFLPKFYDQPERYAFPLELSFLSERFAQLKKEMANDDLFAPVVVSDYIISKCQIFAKNNLQNDEYQLFLKMYELVDSTVKKPDLMVYLYQSIDQLLANIRKRGRAYEQKIEATYLDNIQRQYMEFIRQHQDQRVLIIDMAGIDFVADEEQYQVLKKIILQPREKGITRMSVLGHQTSGAL